MGVTGVTVAMGHILDATLKATCQEATKGGRRDYFLSDALRVCVSYLQC